MRAIGSRRGARTGRTAALGVFAWGLSAEERLEVDAGLVELVVAHVEEEDDLLRRVLANLDDLADAQA
ncbi:hypothetical protein [Pengzhenrongella frigida]|uniref:hypothetical protein n=1 Tax=Pengzhenrongella frigida TaxID=1259133 RepID=UPI0013EC4EB5|nr:hypothetical protein [Cellulomonas sp. HLT2-17]